MSFVKVINKNYDTVNAFSNLINYCMNDLDDFGEKTQLVFNAVYGLNPVTYQTLINDFNKAKDIHNQSHGKQLYHIVISIYKKDIDRSIRETSATWVMDTIGNWILSNGFQCAAFEHIKFNGNIHIHFIINNINFRTGKRLDNARTFFNQILCLCRNQFNYLNWESIIYD